ncbi:MAG: hypothetical protein ACXU87_16765, partial [Xanthobacteraceae bacterium]
RALARLVLGKEHSFQPDSIGHAEFWTTHYPSQAVVALMDLLNHARSIDLGKLKMPVLVIYTDQDTVVDVAAIRDRFDQIRAPTKLIVDLPEASRHELTGDALAPETVAYCSSWRIAGPGRTRRPRTAAEVPPTGCGTAPAPAARIDLYRSRQRV